MIEHRNALAQKECNSEYCTQENNTHPNLSQRNIHPVWTPAPYNFNVPPPSHSLISQVENSIRGVSAWRHGNLNQVPSDSNNKVTTNGFQFNEDTNKLLLSLDRDLINFVSTSCSSIPTPELTDRASLKIRRQNTIDILYNKEDRKCPNCGLKFSNEDKESFDSHLDEHYRKNAELNRIKRGEYRKSRGWYPSLNDKKSSEVSVNNDNNAENKEKEEVNIPLIPIDDIILEINSDIVKCSLCLEDFDQIYINDQDLLYKVNLQNGKLKDGWYLKNAVWSGSETIHPTCSNK
jgi:uncharacterized protein with PIN domain